MAVRGTISLDDSDFVLAPPTDIPGTSSSPTERDDEVITLLHYTRCMFHWSKCYIIGREFLNGGFGKKAHLHIFVKLEIKKKIKAFKEKMQSHGLRVKDIQARKHPDSAIKYVTKEDRVPFNCRVDWSKLNWLCKLKVIAEEMEFIDNTHPAVVSIPYPVLVNHCLLCICDRVCIKGQLVGNLKNEIIKCYDKSGFKASFPLISE